MDFDNDNNILLNDALLSARDFRPAAQLNFTQYPY